MHLFLNICLFPTYQLETLTHKGEIEKLSHPLLFFNKKPFMLHSCLLNTTCYYKSSLGQKVPAVPAFMFD